MQSMKGAREIGDIGVEGVRSRQPTSISFDTKNSRLSIKKKQTSYFIPFDGTIKRDNELTKKIQLQQVHCLIYRRYILSDETKVSTIDAGKIRAALVIATEIVQYVGSEERTCSGFQGEERMERAVRECRETEIEGHTRSLRPSSIRIPRISVNGPLLPRPFGQCTVWVVDMSPQIPHILRRMGRWCCRAQPTGIRLVTTACYGPPRAILLSLCQPRRTPDSLCWFLSPGSSLLPLSLSRSVYPWKAPPCRRVQCEWPRPLCYRLYASIDTYLPIRAGAMLPIFHE